MSTTAKISLGIGAIVLIALVYYFFFRSSSKGSESTGMPQSKYQGPYSEMQGWSNEKVNRFKDHFIQGKAGWIEGVAAGDFEGDQSWAEGIDDPVAHATYVWNSGNGDVGEYMDNQWSQKWESYRMQNNLTPKGFTK